MACLKHLPQPINIRQILGASVHGLSYPKMPLFGRHSRLKDIPAWMKALSKGLLYIYSSISSTVQLKSFLFFMQHSGSSLDIFWTHATGAGKLKLHTWASPCNLQTLPLINQVTSTSNTTEEHLQALSLIHHLLSWTLIPSHGLYSCWMQLRCFMQYSMITDHKHCLTSLAQAEISFVR